ncbi:hypothetical protein B0J11DRAFT_612483 [Dendryphion nanum]|uniref:Uncharacterized protein n=1 Tax=Dendryphion nanum TaxID=256645 RepID=A0A9P9E7I9_9PLEO|nr:hypothetical protein B0J11DRAFT_612483 [Dendryphion nanum]
MPPSKRGSSKSSSPVKKSMVLPEPAVGHGTPVKGSSVHGLPVQGPPVQGLSVPALPMQGMSAQGPPAQALPVQSSPVQERPIGVAGHYGAFPPGTDYQGPPYPEFCRQGYSHKMMNYQGPIDHGHLSPPLRYNPTATFVPQGPTNNWSGYNNQPQGCMTSGMLGSGHDYNTSKYHGPNNQHWRNNRYGNGYGGGGGHRNRRNSVNKFGNYKKNSHGHGSDESSGSPNSHRQQLYNYNDTSSQPNRKYHNNDNGYNRYSRFGGNKGSPNAKNNQSMAYNPTDGPPDNHHIQAMSSNLGGGGMNQHFVSPLDAHSQMAMLDPRGPYNGPGPLIMTGGSPGSVRNSMDYSQGSHIGIPHSLGPMNLQNAPPHSQSAFPATTLLRPFPEITPTMASRQPVSTTMIMLSGAPNDREGADSSVAGHTGTHNNMTNHAPDRSDVLTTKTTPLPPLSISNGLPEPCLVPESERFMTQIPQGLRPRAPTYYPEGFPSPSEGEPNWALRCMSEDGQALLHSTIASVAGTDGDAVPLKRNNMAQDEKDMVTSSSDRTSLHNMQKEKDLCNENVFTISLKVSSDGVPEHDMPSSASGNGPIKLQSSTTTDIPRSICILPTIMEEVITASPEAHHTNLQNAIAYHLEEINHLTKQRDDHIDALGNKFLEKYSLEKEFDILATESFAYAIECFEASTKIGNRDSDLSKKLLQKAVGGMKRTMKYQARLRIERKCLESIRTDMEKTRWSMFDDLSVLMVKSLSSIRDVLHEDTAMPEGRRNRRVMQKEQTKRMVPCAPADTEVGSRSSEDASTIISAVDDEFTSEVTKKLNALHEIQEPIMSGSDSGMKPEPKQKVAFILGSPCDGESLDRTLPINNNTPPIVVEVPLLIPHENQSEATQKHKETDQGASLKVIQQYNNKPQDEELAKTKQAGSQKVVHAHELTYTDVKKASYVNAPEKISKSSSPVSGTPRPSQIVLATDHGQQTKAMITTGDTPVFVGKSSKSSQRDGKEASNAELQVKQEPEGSRQSEKPVADVISESEKKGKKGLAVGNDTEKLQTECLQLLTQIPQAPTTSKSATKGQSKDNSEVQVLRELNRCDSVSVDKTGTLGPIKTDNQTSYKPIIPNPVLKPIENLDQSRVQSPATLQASVQPQAPSVAQAHTKNAIAIQKPYKPASEHPDPIIRTPTPVLDQVVAPATVPAANNPAPPPKFKKRNNHIKKKNQGNIGGGAGAGGSNDNNPRKKQPNQGPGKKRSSATGT